MFWLEIRKLTFNSYLKVFREQYCIYLKYLDKLSYHNIPQGLQSTLMQSILMLFLNEKNKFSNTGAHMNDSTCIHQMTK